MEETSLLRIMILLAVATPVTGLTSLAVASILTRRDQTPMPRAMRRNLWILVAAGPANLALWLLFNGWLDRVGYRSILGYVAAAAVFAGAGFATGFLIRLMRKSDERREYPPDHGPQHESANDGSDSHSSSYPP